MKITIIYKKEKNWFIGHIQEYPDYESQELWGHDTKILTSSGRLKKIHYGKNSENSRSSVVVK